MKFWDSSALVPLFIAHPSSEAAAAVRARDSGVAAWISSDVELHSAVRRLEREGLLGPDLALEVLARIETTWPQFLLISQVEAVKVRAKRLLGLHPLRAADAMQLGAALAWTYDQPLGRELVCLDQRLAAAARREGFTVLPS